MDVAQSWPIFTALPALHVEKQGTLPVIITGDWCRTSVSELQQLTDAKVNSYGIWI
jgi:hypothetical protein